MDIHTVKDITSGKTVTLGRLVEIAENKGFDLDEVYVSVSDSRWTEYRDLILSVREPEPAEPEEEPTVKYVDLSPEDGKRMYEYLMKGVK